MSETPTLESAVVNVSSLLKLSEDSVKKEILGGIRDFTDTQKFFVFRSLTNQVLLSDCSFSNLESYKKSILLSNYIEEHSFIGDFYANYSDVRYIFTSDYYNKFRKDKINSMEAYLSYALNQGFNSSANCLFPRKNIDSFSEFELFWIAITSKWVRKTYKSFPIATVGSQLAQCYGINRYAIPYKSFIDSCSSQHLIQASIYTPKVLRTAETKPTWKDYKNIPISLPLLCLAPLGFDFMAYMYFGYVDKMDFTNIWSDNE